MARKDSFGDWQRFLDRHGGWQSDRASRNTIENRLKRFGVADADLDTTLVALSVGHALLLAGVGWSSPSAGPGGKAAAARGAQWRLAMAWGGFESSIKACTGTIEGTRFPHKALKAFVSALSFAEDSVPELRRPKKTALMEKWLSSYDSGTLRFLHVGVDDKKTLEAWIRGDKGTAGDLASQIHLARILRNATVHGALSATKVQQLGLVEPLQSLVELIAQVDQKLFAVLAAEDE
jgi:hypothetical protein